MTLITKGIRFSQTAADYSPNWAACTVAAVSSQRPVEHTLQYFTKYQGGPDATQCRRTPRYPSPIEIALSSRPWTEWSGVERKFVLKSSKNEWTNLDADLLSLLLVLTSVNPQIKFFLLFIIFWLGVWPPLSVFQPVSKKDLAEVTTYNPLGMYARQHTQDRPGRESW